MPLGVVVSGANTPDGRLLEATLASLPIERPEGPTMPQHLCLDKAYSDGPSADVARAYAYEIHVPDKANAKKNVSARRGVGKRGGGSSRSPTHG